LIDEERERRSGLMRRSEKGRRTDEERDKELNDEECEVVV
jgi:hypothetical protein